MREKHTALMKPIVFALEHVRSITAAPAETPHEKWFQDNYGDSIENALEKLKNPSNPAKPGSSWIPFKEVERFKLAKLFVLKNHACLVIPYILEDKPSFSALIYELKKPPSAYNQVKVGN